MAEQFEDVPYQVPLTPTADGGGIAVFEVWIKTTPERLWEAITDPELRAKYTFGTRVESDWAEGSPYAGRAGDYVISEGVNTVVDPPNRLVQTFTAKWSPEVEAIGASRVTWEIRAVADSCQLTVIHDELPADANPELYGGWPMILSGLKTLIETGAELTTPGSLRYAEMAG